MNLLRLGLFAGLMLGGCAADKPYRSFGALDYGYQRAQTHWTPRAKLRLHSEELGPLQGSRTPVVLLHPWGLNMRVWASVAPQLADQRRVVMIDLPGHGKSEKLHTNYSMQRLGTAVWDTIDQLGLKKVILVGNSLGGATSIATALQRPERVEAIVLIAAPGGKRLESPIRHLARSVAYPSAIESLSNTAWYVGFNIVARKSNQVSDKVVEDILALREAREWGAYANVTSSLLQEVANYTPDLSTLKMPALVVHGGWDLLIRDSYSQSLSQQLSKGKMVTMEECGHMPEIECPRALVEIMKQFFDQPEQPEVATR